MSPILGAALVEVEQLAGRIWQSPTAAQAEALDELRVAMAVDALVPLLVAATTMDRLVTEEWLDGPSEQAACQQRLHHALHRRR